MISETKKKVNDKKEYDEFDFQATSGVEGEVEGEDKEGDEKCLKNLKYERKGKDKRRKLDSILKEEKEFEDDEDNDSNGTAYLSRSLSTCSEIKVEIDTNVKVEDGSWNCSQCTFINKPKTIKCEACRHMAPSSSRKMRSK
eukprot:CAMPEP_0114334034 /NCGR_PEP_ID=MMETSP0101-20121206/4120_1 /TAXON_ID=38822 ORGANISM="Pteridomonas danica, Strain PT" /NCGR_SAMPLE_ID=MMETSP0101 /ASSEMBLY_ACC=CAM_ASM_000211 /LENGTH=140 /DNA_ID=CAMNT_0001465187 /DNA_START=914 /DNA_END=1333 /DNA_ORIENTATION=-